MIMVKCPQTGRAIRRGAGGAGQGDIRWNAAVLMRSGLRYRRSRTDRITRIRADRLIWRSQLIWSDMVVAPAQNRA